MSDEDYLPSDYEDEERLLVGSYAYDSEEEYLSGETTG
jgi:hypothetical protein